MRPCAEKQISCRLCFWKACGCEIVTSTTNTKGNKGWTSKRRGTMKRTSSVQLCLYSNGLNCGYPYTTELINWWRCLSCKVNEIVITITQRHEKGHSMNEPMFCHKDNKRGIFRTSLNTAEITGKLVILITLTNRSAGDAVFARLMKSSSLLRIMKTKWGWANADVK